MIGTILRVLWKKADGKKTAAGIVVTVAGIALFWTPAAPVAGKVVDAGLALTGVGLLHKGAKAVKKKKGGE